MQNTAKQNYPDSIANRVTELTSVFSSCSGNKCFAPNILPVYNHLLEQCSLWWFYSCDTTLAGVMISLITAKHM